jgi:mannose-6-phosphate isomerase-like protein (cupin superfamily)
MDGSGGLDARNLYDTKDAVITILKLPPGESLRKHITPVDVAFFVLEGTGIVLVGDEKEEVGPYTLIESPKGIVHCWYNEGSTDLLIMVIKAPKPQSKTIFVSDDNTAS